MCAADRVGRSGFADGFENHPRATRRKPMAQSRPRTARATVTLDDVAAAATPVRGRPDPRPCAEEGVWVDPAPQMGFADWTGSAAMLEDIADGLTLEEVSGLDRARWAVVAVRVDVRGTSGDAGRVVAYAVDAAALGARHARQRHQVLSEYVQAHGALPVSRFDLHDVGLSDIFAQMKRGYLVFRASGYREAALRLDERGAGERPCD